MPNSAQLSPAQLARRVDAISYDGGPGGARQMSYSFESAGGSGLPWGGIVSGYAGWSAAGREAVLAALDDVARISGLSFRPAAAGEEPDMEFYAAADIGGFDGYGGFRWSGDEWDGFVAIRQGSETDHELLLHEIGHALGLKHPRDYDGSVPGPYLSVDEDNSALTVMSYSDGPHDAATPMIYDIAALQARWAANQAAFAGDDVWRAPPAGQAMAIWDAGGRDQIRFAGGRDVVIDLREGAFSSLGAPDNLSIAYGARIENARSGGGDDLLRGNGLDNDLRAGGGDDRLLGLGGADRLVAGGGADLLRGGGGGDLLKGGRGDDRLLGQGGTDRLFGGGGDDVLTGGGGADRLKGGGGADLFRLSAGGPRDEILDFDAAEGDRIRLTGVERFRQLAIEDHDDGVLVTSRSGLSLQLVGLEVADLQRADFLFA